MTQYKVNKAYPALNHLAEFRLPVKKARGIYSMMKMAEEYFQFAVQEENKYVTEFHGKPNPDGTITFESQEDFGKFQERLADLNNSEIEWEFEPVVLTEDDIGNQTITPSDIFYLEGFVAFE